MVATALIALLLLAAGLSDRTFLGGDNGGQGYQAALDCAGLGVILATATGLHALEHTKARAKGEAGSAIWYWLVFSACLVACVICCCALIVGGMGQIYFAVASGVAILIMAILIRRFWLGPWGYSAIASVVVVIAIAAVTLRPADRHIDLMLSFAPQAATPQIALTQRVLLETNWTGTGAGTFAAILPIYKDIDELATGSNPPTAIAAIAVEMGRPFLLAMGLAIIWFVFALLHGAMQRRRDSFYSIAGASCIVAVMLMALDNAALLGAPVSVITAAVVGIAGAQSKSRSIP
jgi:hypothetical protein